MNILGRMDCRVVSSSSRGGWPGLLQVLLHYPIVQASPKTATRCHSTVRKSMACSRQEKGWMMSSRDHGHWWKPRHWCKNWGDKTMATSVKLEVTQKTISDTLRSGSGHRTWGLYRSNKRQETNIWYPEEDLRGVPYVSSAPLALHWKNSGDIAIKKYWGWKTT